MTNRTQLPYLVSLIDDETREVREEVLKGLSNYGPSLEEDLQEFSEALDSHLLDFLKPILENNRRKWLNENWDSWRNLSEENHQLEEALSLIAKFQYGVTYPVKLGRLLDQLSEEFRTLYPFGNEIDLSNFLFNFKRMKGEKEDYYNPFNSNLIYVIKEKKGLPISLACVYILTADRLSLDVKGCNFPGHFLAKTVVDGESVYIDCFNGGKMLFEEDFKTVADETFDSISDILSKNTTAKIIIQRILNNLANAYKNVDDKINSDFISTLLRTKTKD